MASMVIHEVGVWAQFPKGALWLPVGKGADNRLPELMFVLATMVWEIVLAKRVRPPAKGGAVVKPEDGAEYIRRNVGERSCRSFRVVADDVWEEKVLAELRKAGVWVLYTSRHCSLSEPVVWLGTIGREEAEAVLRQAGELEDRPLPNVA